MTIKVKLPNGTVIECDTPEEAARFMQAQQKQVSSDSDEARRDTADGPYCGGCGNNHFGMC